MGILTYFQKLMMLGVYGYRYNSNLYLKHLRNKGMKIGDGTVLFSSQTSMIDESVPHMITIGKNVQITGGL